MATETTVSFHFDDLPFLLRLHQLDNELVGEDYATFVISADDGSLTEEQKIERLLHIVADSSGITFIRNGEEHSAAEAVEHLLRKWKANRDNIVSAEQFIDAIASKSSQTGKKYRIRLTDGQVIDSGDFLREQLRRIEEGR